MLLPPQGLTASERGGTEGASKYIFIDSLLPFTHAP